MSSINDFRRALRAYLTEGVESQGIAMLTVQPGKPAEDETVIEVVGFDRAMSRVNKGFGGDDDKDIGAWSTIGLPDRSDTGMTEPPPWVLFMDWLWAFLKSAGLEPYGLEGFGDDSLPYGKMTVSQKRQRKYGEGVRGEYDVKKLVVIGINSLGETPEDVYLKFSKKLKSTKLPPWFTIIPDTVNPRWVISVKQEMEVPEGWEQRKQNMDIYKHQHNIEWHNAIVMLADKRTNPAQLSPLVKLLLVRKHKFDYPFNIDVMDDPEFKRAISIIESLTLDDMVAFAREHNKTLVIAKSRASNSTALLKHRWNKLIDDLAGASGLDPYVVQVAVADYMVAKGGFPDPFDIELIAPAQLAKAIVAAHKLTPEDIRASVESVQQQIDRLRSEPEAE